MAWFVPGGPQGEFTVLWALPSPIRWGLSDSEAPSPEKQSLRGNAIFWCLVPLSAPQPGGSAIGTADTSADYGVRWTWFRSLDDQCDLRPALNLSEPLSSYFYDEGNHTCLIKLQRGTEIRQVKYLEILWSFPSLTSLTP